MTTGLFRGGFFRPILGAVLCFTLLTGCDRESPDADEGPARREDSRPKADPVTRADLENLKYRSEFTRAGSIELTKGVYRESAAPGSATETVILLTDHVAFGDLNGDGIADAVAVIETDPGGSGIFFELVAVVAGTERSRPVDSVPLGDRVGVEQLTLEDGTVQVELITHGPEDPLCCPSAREERRYRLIGDALVTQADDGDPPLVQGHG